MKTTTAPALRRLITGFFGLASLMLMGGCTSETKPWQAPATKQPAALSPPGPALPQPTFDSDGDVVNALLAAVRSQDHEQVHRLLGPGWKELTSGDKVEDANDFKDFAARAAEHVRIEKRDESTSALRVGSDNWLFPIPIVKNSDGKWFLDTEAGKSEVLARRIGQNELEAIAICRLYVKAQRQYASQDRDGSGGMKYAQRILSTPGRRDGLYWHAADGSEQSPFARLIAEEKVEGYQPTSGNHAPYRGYRYRVLKRQGADAPGGKRSYVINGNMTGGFALIAYPAAYESSGVMTFIVNQDGIVYQKDLGTDTGNLARHVTEYDPDGSWTRVQD